MISKDFKCEGQFNMGPMGYVYTNYVQDSVEIYRCLVIGNGDHFVSNDKNCEGNKVEMFIGYVMN